MNIKLGKVKEVYRDFPTNTAIYFLLKKSKKQKLNIVYIGISRNVYNRIRSHKKDKDFEYYRIIKSRNYNSDYDYMEKRESQFISKFKPKYNIKRSERYSSPFTMHITKPFWSDKYKSFLRITYNYMYMTDKEVDEFHNKHRYKDDVYDKYYVHNIEYYIPSEEALNFISKVKRDARNTRKLWDKRKIMRRLNRVDDYMKKTDLKKEFAKESVWKAIEGFKKYKTNELDIWPKNGYPSQFYRKKYKYKTNGKVVLL